MLNFCERENRGTTNYTTFITWAMLLFHWIWVKTNLIIVLTQKRFSLLQGESSGLDKRQCTAKLTMFPDGSVFPTNFKFYRRR